MGKKQNYFRLLRVACRLAGKEEKYDFYKGRLLRLPREVWLDYIKKIK